MEIEKVTRNIYCLSNVFSQTYFFLIVAFQSNKTLNQVFVIKEVYKIKIFPVLYQVLRFMDKSSESNYYKTN